MQSKINYLDLGYDYRKNLKKYTKLIQKNLLSGKFLPGPNVNLLEKKISDFLNVKNCVTLNSGTDALFYTLNCLKIKRGSEIITTPNTWYSTISAIVHCGFIPKFVDIKLDQNFNEKLIEKNINKKTKAVLAVHLNGKMVDIIKIKKICKKYNLFLIEDAAQAFGSSFNKIQPGQISDAACFSCHPTKTLYSFRDGGFVVSNNAKLIEKIRLLKNHGIKSNRDECYQFGFNSRIDNLQATILLEKLKEIKSKIKKRNNVAKFYIDNLDKKKYLIMKNEKSIVHSYQFFHVICKLNTNKLLKYLLKKKIEVYKYFHIPIYSQKAYTKLNLKGNVNLDNCEYMKNKSINLPIRENLKLNEIKYIVETMNNFE